jgi:hypothetical protein
MMVALECLVCFQFLINVALHVLDWARRFMGKSRPDREIVKRGEKAGSALA